MTEGEVCKRAKEIYVRCFDDYFNYSGVLIALEIAVRETASELEAQIEKMKNGDNCKYGCIACGNYICELGLENCNTIPFHCDKWELDK